MLYTHGKYFHSECYWGATSDTFLMCFGRLHSTNKFYKVFFSRIYTTSSRYVFSGTKHALRKTAYLPSRTGVWQAYYLTLKPILTQTLTFSYTCPRSVRCILHPGKRLRKEIMRPARPLHSMVLGWERRQVRDSATRNLTVRRQSTEVMYRCNVHVLQDIHISQ